MKMNTAFSKLIPLLAVLTLSGCGFQHEIIQRRHWQLNDTIRETSIEQLLLNIVRLRYDDTPYFLQVSSISTQFSAQGSLGVSGTIPEGGANVLGLNSGISYSESPIVTWSLPDSSALYARLLTPMSADQLTALAGAGWEPTRVLRWGIKKINRLRNVEFRVESGILTPSTYEDFLQVMQFINELSRDGAIDFATGPRAAQRPARSRPT